MVKNKFITLDHSIYESVMNKSYTEPFINLKQNLLEKGEHCHFDNQYSFINLCYRFLCIYEED
jgi:hypothetical protein